MKDFESDAAEATASPDAVGAVEYIAGEVREDIRLGHVEDDVSHVLKERLDEAGLHVRPDSIDELAEDVENDASR